MAGSMGMQVVDDEVSHDADVSIVAIEASAGFSADARRAVAVARTAGVPHVVLAVVASAPATPAMSQDIAAAFSDFAGKLQLDAAVAVPMSVSLADGDAFLRSHLASLGAGVPRAKPQRVAPLCEQFTAHVACVSAQELLPGREYRLRLPGQETTASVTAVQYRLESDTFRRLPARRLARGDIGLCTITSSEPLALEEPAQGGETIRFSLSDLFTDETVAAGSVDFTLSRGMNIYWQPFAVTKELRAAAKEQHPCVVWFTGLSGAGKSTIANLVEGRLATLGRHTYLLDGDNVRHGLNKDLGFTAADRVENIRRVGEVARLFVDAGIIVLCSFISPFRAEREAVRNLVGPSEFVEIYVTAPLDVCERRDPKGLYAKSRAGLLPNFTGIDSPYEEPTQPDLVLDTSSASANELALRVISLLEERGVVPAPPKDSRTANGL